MSHHHHHDAAVESSPFGAPLVNVDTSVLILQNVLVFKLV